jgi:hypothetical protein
MSFPTPEHEQAAQEAADLVYAETKVYVWPSGAVAQVDIESAGATRLAGKNNFGGIKATQAQIASGDASYFWTEEVINGARVKVKQWFATYPTLKDFYVAHARLLATHKVYSTAWKVTDAKAFIRAIAPHYATAPNYAEVVIAVMDRLDLYRLDHPHPNVVLPKPSVVAVHPATVPAASGVGGVVVGAVVAGSAASGAHVPWPLIGAAAVVSAVAAVLWLVASRKKTVLVTAANTAAPPPTPPAAAPAPAPLPPPIPVSAEPLPPVAAIPDRVEPPVPPTPVTGA